MQIGGTSPYLLPAALPRPAHSVPANASPDVSSDLTRAAQAPVTPTPSLDGQQSPSAHEEADQSANQRPHMSEGSPARQRSEQLQVAELASRDREVRAHEQAHAAVGGSHAGAPSYTYSRGPDGQRYAVGGEVSIDTGAVSNDPQATLDKMEVVVRAALAPAEPSAQDRSVAAQAQAQMAQARVELSEQQSREGDEARSEQADAERQEQQDSAERSSEQSPPPTADLDIYRRLAGAPESGPQIDFVA